MPEDVVFALKDAHQRESDPHAKVILSQLLKNAHIAFEDRIPPCQDTGVAIVFIELGSSIHVEPPPDNPDATLKEAIQDGVKRGYKNNLLRMSMAHEPLKQRINTQANTPTILHFDIVCGNKLKISLMAKGGGCENKSQFEMFNPTESHKAVCSCVRFARKKLYGKLYGA